jgi:splicing factor 3A subunit 1
MAPSATNGDALAVLDEIKAPAGVVIPPKEIKGKISLPLYKIERNR